MWFGLREVAVPTTIIISLSPHTTTTQIYVHLRQLMMKYMPAPPLLGFFRTRRPVCNGQTAIVLELHIHRDFALMPSVRVILPSAMTFTLYAFSTYYHTTLLLFWMRHSCDSRHHTLGK